MRVRLLLDDEPLFDSGDKDHAPGLVKALAVAWCGMTDDEQAQFFEECARIMASWPLGADTQRHYIASHMRKCDCISDAGRELLFDLAERVRAK